MYKLDKNKILLYGLWIIVFALLIAVFIFYFWGENTLATSFFLGLLGTFAMLAIALQTFLKMDESMRKQVEDFNDLLKELKQTNLVLNSVSKSLNIVSKDVIARQKQSPNLYITFGGNRNQIDLRTGEECEVKFELHNAGLINASNPCWVIFLPGEIEIIDKKEFRSIKQGRGTEYPGSTGLFKDRPRISARSKFSTKIKIKTEKTNIGLVKIPFDCSCDNTPESSDNLLINFIG